MHKRFGIADILPPALAAKDRGKIMESAANVVVTQIQQWYAGKPEDYFDGPRHDGAAARSFMRGVQSHWFADAGKADGFDVYFSNPREGGANFGLLLHEYGGTITPKRAQALAIPLHADARKAGSPREYEESYAGGELFVLKGENNAVLAWQDETGELIASYVLLRSATVPSLQERRGHPAVPPDEQVAEWAISALLENLNAYNTL